MLRTFVAIMLAQPVNPPAPQPVAPPAALKPRTSPDDYELFLESILEAPRGQRKVWNGKVYSAPYKCAPAVPCPGVVCPLAPPPRPAPK
jgi:pilus assembly protein CpaC